MSKRGVDMGVRIAAGVAVLVAAGAAPVWAQEGEASQPEELVRVVQPKPVRKARRLEITPFFAYQPNDDFLRGFVPGLIVGWHLNEGLALEATAGYGIYGNKRLLDTVREMNTQPRVLDRMRYLLNGGFSWTPIYGKIAVLDRWILTYDFYIAAGGGMTSTELEITREDPSDDDGFEGETFRTDAMFFDTYIGLGQRYFWKNWGAFRFEVKNFSYAQVVDDGFNIRNNLLLAGGFSFFF